MEGRDSTPLLIGTYTERLPHVDGKAAGILGSTYRDGAVAPAGLLAEAVSPAWLIASADATRVYAVHETTSFHGEPGGGVSAFDRDPATGGLTLIDSVHSGGIEPAHLALAPDGRFLLVANYRSGSVAAFTLRDDGGVGERTALVRHSGSSAHPVRQTSPHPHQVVRDPVDGLFLVPDLGLDTILRYRLDETGRLVEAAERIEAPLGSGPRHLAFHPDGEHLFLAGELGSSLTVFRRSGSGFRTIQTLSTLPAGEGIANSASEVLVSPSGGSVLVSNRGANAVAVFAVAGASGTVELSSMTASGGEWPRSFSFAADGTLLLVANQNTDSIVPFDWDESRRSLRIRPAATALTPVCILVL